MDAIDVICAGLKLRKYITVHTIHRDHNLVRSQRASGKPYGTACCSMSPERFVTSILVRYLVFQCCKDLAAEPTAWVLDQEQALHAAMQAIWR
jgi:hypothetical protein